MLILFINNFFVEFLNWKRYIIVKYGVLNKFNNAISVHLLKKFEKIYIHDCLKLFCFQCPSQLNIILEKIQNKWIWSCNTFKRLCVCIYIYIYIYIFVYNIAWNTQLPFKSMTFTSIYFMIQGLTFKCNMT